MNCDILFIDASCSRPYTHETLEQDAIGGSEGSTIRLAEGFASKGLKVVVVQHFEVPYHESPNGVVYCGVYWANVVKPKNVIYVRAKGIWDRYNAKRFLWLHDASKQDHNNMGTWVEGLVEHNVQSIAVSDWHVGNVSQFAPGIPIKRIYSPMDETCFQEPTSYDKDQLVWLASPHKGLKEGLELFKELRLKEPRFKLAVFNPGYYQEDSGIHQNVVFLPKQPRKVLRSVVAHSLAFFYPTQFEETFGLVAAESNALGVPVATYGVAALAESSVGPFATDPNNLLNQVIEWREKGRPVIRGQDRFRFENIYPEWLKVLKL